MKNSHHLLVTDYPPSSHFKLFLHQSMKKWGLDEHERMQNLRGAVELLAGASTACRMILLHHGHRLRVHRLPHRARSDQNPGGNPKMKIRRAGRGDSPVPRGRARAPRRPPRAPAAAAGSDKQRRARAGGGAARARGTWRRSACAELERRDASGARWCRWSCSTRCATSGGGGGRDAAAAAFDIAGGAGVAGGRWLQG